LIVRFRRVAAVGRRASYDEQKVAGMIGYPPTGAASSSAAAACVAPPSAAAQSDKNRSDSARRSTQRSGQVFSLPH